MSDGEVVGIKTATPGLNLFSRLGIRPPPDLDCSTTIVPVLDVLAATAGGETVFDIEPVAGVGAFSAPTSGPKFKHGAQTIALAATFTCISAIPALSIFRLHMMLQAGTIADGAEFLLRESAGAVIIARFGQGYFSQTGMAFGPHFKTPLLRHTVQTELVCAKVLALNNMSIAYGIELVST